MKRTNLILAVLAAAFAVSCSEKEIPEDKLQGAGDKIPVITKEPDAKLIENAMFHEGVAIVKFTEEMALAIEKGSAAESLSSKAEGLDMKIVERVFPDAGEFEERTRREGLHRFYLVEFDHALTYAKASSVISALEGVEIVEPCRIARSADFNDPNLSRLWGFVGNKNIHVKEAWEYTTGNPDVIVCVVDEGIQQNHPDLQWNIHNENYNFVRRTSTINAGDHGTHVAGTIGAVSNNGVGIAGIAGGNYAENKRGISLQSAQVFDGNYSAASFASAIKWGADHGAVISQNSWGYDFDFNDNGVIDADEYEYAMSATVSASDAAAIDYFTKYAGCDNAGEQLEGSPMKGGIVVFAAGNDALSNGIPAIYPTAVAVGATTSSGTVSSFSNWGEWVDICAPGTSILSTISGSRYATYSGTSMACPHVSGACALLVSYFGGPGFTNELLREFLLEGANPSAISYGGYYVGPYLDLKSSFDYGIAKLKRVNNNDPVISTDYEGDFTFRQYQTVEIPFTVTDPDGDKVAVTAETGGIGELIHDEADPDHWYLRIVGVNVNDFSAKNASIVATDQFGGRSEYSFRLQVLRNNEPKAVGKLNDIIIVGVGTQHKINLAGLFTDEDGETLKLTAKDTPTAPARFKLDGQTLTITPYEYGTSTMTVSATDGLWAKASLSFRYLVRATDTEMDFYPNPVKDVLHIRTGINPETTEIVLENSTGNVLYKGSLLCSAFDPVKLDMSKYAPGLYTLRVTVGGKTYVNNVVKR